MEKTYTITEAQLRKFVQRGWDMRAGHLLWIAEAVTIAHINFMVEDAIKELDKKV